jgi:hypothetical protein
MDFTRRFRDLGVEPITIEEKGNIAFIIQRGKYIYRVVSFAVTTRVGTK